MKFSDKFKQLVCEKLKQKISHQEWRVSCYSPQKNSYEVAVYNHYSTSLKTFKNVLSEVEQGKFSLLCSECESILDEISGNSRLTISDQFFVDRILEEYHAELADYYSASSIEKSISA